MTRLPGVPLDTVWDELSAQDHDRLADHLGCALAELHHVPPPAIRDWSPADWPEFAATRRAQCADEQRAWGLPPLWADQIPGFLDAVALPSGRPALLHTEVMRQHLLVTHGHEGRWRLSGR